MKAPAFGIAAALSICALLPLRAAATDTPAASDASPDWVKTVSPHNCPGSVMPSYYPPRAHQMALPGVAAIRCRVLINGSVDRCLVVSEKPPDEGFGAAAVRMSCLFKVKPKKLGARPAEGAEVTIPIRFDLKN